MACANSTRATPFDRELWPSSLLPLGGALETHAGHSFTGRGKRAELSWFAAAVEQERMGILLGLQLPGGPHSSCEEGFRSRDQRTQSVRWKGLWTYSTSDGAQYELILLPPSGRRMLVVAGDSTGQRMLGCSGDSMEGLWRIGRDSTRRGEI